MWLLLLTLLLRIGMVIDEGILVLVKVGVAVGGRGVEAGDGVQRMGLGVRMSMVGMGEALQGGGRRRRMVAAGR